MQLFVKTIAGASVCVEAAAHETVESLKARLGSDAELFFAGQLMAADATLGDYQVYAEATIHESLPVEGGKGKKKKKRIFTKPKKNAHRHKKETMRVLKYYAVTGDGENEEYKIERTRTECRHPQCGPAVFMAKHKDGRQTCGKCSLTYAAQKKN